MAGHRGPVTGVSVARVAPLPTARVSHPRKPRDRAPSSLGRSLGAARASRCDLWSEATSEGHPHGGGVCVLAPLIPTSVLAAATLTSKHSPRPWFSALISMLILWSPTAEKSAQPKWAWKGWAPRLEGGRPSAPGHPQSMRLPRNQSAGPLSQQGLSGDKGCWKQQNHLPWSGGHRDACCVSSQAEPGQRELPGDPPGPHTTPSHPHCPVATQ